MTALSYLPLFGRRERGRFGYASAGTPIAIAPTMARHTEKQAGSKARPGACGQSRFDSDPCLQIRSSKSYDPKHAGQTVTFWRNGRQWEGTIGLSGKLVGKHTIG